MTTSSDPETLLGIKPEQADPTSARAVESPKAAVEPPTMDHEYDGIREYDNPMPRWWVLTFWATFVFAIGYFFHYHVSERGQSVAHEYEADVQRAREAKAQAAMGETVSEASLNALMADTSLMADTKALYAQRCAPCHADKCQGLIGPNLTDNAWIHGDGKLMDIFKTVSKGVLEKGMPAWEMQLTPMELRKIAAYIGSMRGKNVPGKPPEGHVTAQ